MCKRLDKLTLSQQVLQAVSDTCATTKLRIRPFTFIMWISTTLIAILLHANVVNGNSCPVKPILEKLTLLENKLSNLEDTSTSENSLLAGIEERLARLESSSRCSEVATCVAPPAVANTTSDKPYEVEHPGTATYKCAKGYISNGELGVIKCQKNGEWSQLRLVCTGVSCGSLLEVYGLETDVKEPVSFPGTVTYLCAPGFHEHHYYKGPVISRCQEDGTWSWPDKTCVADD
ncbi:hypothetical protein ScPMuIL_015943 [Solemya velum]